MMAYSPRNKHWPVWAVIPVLFAAVFLIYANTFHSPFIFDDYNSIQANSHIRLHELSFKALRDAAFNSPIKTRPLAYLTFALNYYFNGLNPLGYHLVNIFIHAINSVLLFFLFRQVLTSPAMAMEKKKAVTTALAAALIWAVHPLATNSVTYIVQRMNSLSAGFFILAMLAYGYACGHRGSRRGRYGFIISAIAAVAAMGSKENAFTLPFFLLLYDWFFFGDLSRAWFVERRREIAFAAAMAIILAGVIICLYSGNPLQLIKASYESRDFTLGQRLLTEWRVIFFYLSLIFFPLPARMNLDHYFSLSTGLLNPPQTFLSLLGLVLLAGWAMASARKKRLLSFAVLWFLGNLLIESSFIGLELVFEHRTYLPSMFLFPSLLLIVERIIGSRKIKTSMLIVVLLILGLWTWQRNQVWRSEVSLRMDSAVKAPKKARPQAILANALVRVRQNELAIKYYRKALRLSPSNAAEIEYNLGNALLKCGRLPEAEKVFRKVAQEHPKMFQPRLNLGYVLMREGKIEPAVEIHRHLIADFPAEARGHLNYGILLEHIGRKTEAEREYLKTLALDPENRSARFRLTRIRGRLHRTDSSRSSR